MIYLFNDPQLFETDCVLQGPAMRPDQLRMDFARAMNGDRDKITASAFKEWLIKERGFEDLGDFIELEREIYDGELTAWSASFVGGPKEDEPPAVQPAPAPASDSGPSFEVLED